nr:electron transport complex subunit RsxC [Pantoea bituminis]
MLNLLNFFKKDKVWDFQGGIHPPEMKTQSNGTPLSELPLPHRFIIPLKQHIGHEGEICVSPGDKVLRGQPLTFGQGRMLPVHAPTSGVIDDIGQHMTAHPSGLSELCIFMTPDGEDRWMPLDPLPNYRQHERADIVQRIHDAGVAGLGGAGFPTATKLKGGLRGIKTLIINAAECEPYITADDRLMQDCAAEVLEGSRILAWTLQAERVLIGIEDNKPEAITALKHALGSERDLEIRVIPTKYPSGGAKQLTQILTGKEVPHGGRSTDIGVLMQNVGTAWAVKRAIINGEPITERVVTLTGEAIAQPRNVWSRLGTPISHLLHQVGFRPAPQQMVIMGGPLMGFTLPSLDVPVVKITNCILAPSSHEMGNNDEEQSCIRCSACADACPANLLPQQLYWYSQGGDHDKARAHHIDDCIECGACAYVCPSNIPLVQYYRQEKAELRAIDLEAKRTLEAKARFEARQARLEREKLAREARHVDAKQRAARCDNAEFAAAKVRVKAKQDAEVDDATLEAQREARHAQARLRQAETQAETQALSRQVTDPRKAAVEAAIARAKAKKAAAADAPVETAAEPAADAPEDPRKAAVAAAIARAKAKKPPQRTCRWKPLLSLLPTRRKIRAKPLSPQPLPVPKRRKPPQRTRRWKPRLSLLPTRRKIRAKPPSPQPLPVPKRRKPPQRKQWWKPLLSLLPTCRKIRVKPPSPQPLPVQKRRKPPQRTRRWKPRLSLLPTCRKIRVKPLSPQPLPAPKRKSRRSGGAGGNRG